MKNAKGTFIRVGSRIGWRLGVRWYCLTERASESHGHPVEPAGSCEEIAKRLSFGNAYKPDPWKGRLDIMRHPRRIQRWIDEGKPVGDCDEHAAYWCACLLKSGLVDNVWMGTLQMQAPDGTISGHAVSVFDRPGTGSLWTADYDVPVSIGTDRWGWVDVYCQRYGAKPVFATLAKVIRLDADDLIVMRPEAARGYR